MQSKKDWYVNDDYRKWREFVVPVAGAKLLQATKPGVFAHGSLDPSALLLAQQVRAENDQVVVHLNCRNGLLGAALAHTGKARRVILADRNVLAVEAALRTLDANGLAGTDVHLSHGAVNLPPITADIVAVRIPQEKLALLQLIHDAFAILKVGGHCYLAGATNEGAKSAGNTLEQLFGNATTVATENGHRIIRAIKRGNEHALAGAPSSPYIDPNAFHEQQLEIGGAPRSFFSRPGVFSWDHLDEATAILAEHVVVRPDDRVLDLGCGYGVLGVVAGRIATVHPVTLLDVDAEAVRSTERSARANGLVNARVIGSDVASAVLDEQFDLVVTNPPFHVGKATDLAVPIQFIADAYHVLAPGGRLNLVANRTLPYEGAIKYLFRNITTVHDGRRFKVLSAIKEP